MAAIKSEAYCCNAAGSMGEKGKLVIGFETNCVPDLNALLDDGEDRMAKHILRAPLSNCLAEDLFYLLPPIKYTKVDRLLVWARSFAAPHTHGS